MRLLQHCRLGSFLDGVAESSGEADSANDAEGILVKALFRIANGTEKLFFDICLSAEGVCYAPLLGICYGVYGEVAAGKILLDALGEGHAFWVAGVLVFAVYAVGGYFILLAVFDERYRSVLYSRFDDSFTRKYSLGFLGERACSYIKIVGLNATQKIADGAAYYIGTIACVFKLFKYFAYVFRKRKSAHYGILSLFCYIFRPFYYFSCFFLRCVLQYIGKDQNLLAYPHLRHSSSTAHRRLKPSRIAVARSDARISSICDS